MTILGKALVINQSFVQNSSEDYEFIVSNVSKTPRKQLAILTCMDTRLVDFLEPALGDKTGRCCDYKKCRKLCD